MDLYPTSSEYAHWSVTADVDLATATIEVYLGGVWQAATWEAAAVHTGSTWTRTASILLAGSVGATGLVLTASAFHPRYRITIPGSEVIVRRSANSINLKLSA